MANENILKISKKILSLVRPPPKMHTLISIFEKVG